MALRGRLYTWFALFGLIFGACSEADITGGQDGVTGAGGATAAVGVRSGGIFGVGGEINDTSVGGAPGSGDGGNPLTGIGGGMENGMGGFGCVEAGTTRLSMSSDDSNSMGSPVYAREMLSAGKAPDPSQIRTYEFLNYYTSGYPAAKEGTLAVSLSFTGGAGKLNEPYRLQIGVASPPPQAPRLPLAITMVVDTSPSMAGHGIENARAVVTDIASSLKPGDTVSLVTLDAAATPLTDGQVIPMNGDVSAVTAKINKLVVGGSSDLQGGLVRAYAMAYKYFSKEGLNRVVLITDGRTNPASVDTGFINENAKKGDDDGILLVGVATGPADGYNDALLNELTDKGRGAYIFIDDPTESTAVFSGRFSEVMDIAARSVRVTAALPGYLELQEYFGETVSEATTEVEPQHLAPGDAMIFNMKLNAKCAAPLAGDPDSIDVHVDWIEPRTLISRSVDASGVIGALLNSSLPTQMVKSNAIIAYAEALKSNDVTRLKLAVTAISDALTALGGTEPELTAIGELLAKHPLLAAP